MDSILSEALEIYQLTQKANFHLLTKQTDTQDETNPVRQLITPGFIAVVHKKKEALRGESCVSVRASEEMETMLHYSPERVKGGRERWMEVERIEQMVPGAK